MILLLDIGNTRIKWALANTGIVHAAALTHGGKPAAALTQLPLAGADAIWIAQVFGAAEEMRLTRAVKKICGLTPQYAHSSKRVAGLVSAYREPQRLGVDRWLAMLAARRLTRGAFCVVDAGTALTVDCVDASSRHLGGIIAPGLATAERALLGATRFATHARAPRVRAGLGRDTESCVHQGAYLACLGAIDRAAQAAGPRARKFITGGDAPTLLPQLGKNWQHRPQLVLEGLLVLAASTH